MKVSKSSRFKNSGVLQDTDGFIWLARNDSSQENMPYFFSHYTWQTAV